MLVRGETLLSRAGEVSRSDAAPLTFSIDAVAITVLGPSTRAG